MRLKVKTPSGAAAVEAEGNEVIGAWLEQALVKHHLGGSVSGAKSGFPPRPLDLTKTVAEQLRNGDQVVVTTGGPAPSVQEPTPHELIGRSQIPAVYIDQWSKYLILRNIPDDNACMFNALLAAVYGSNSYKDGTSPNLRLREAVVQAIRADPSTYNEVVLDRPVDDYCRWILKKDSWGGAIELGILAPHVGVSIYCIDVELGHFIRFGDADRFVILIYLGIHYDMLATNLVLSVDPKGDVGVWDVADALVVESAALKLCTQLQSKNYATNTTTFRLRCLECYAVLVGEMGASKHANETGHSSFGEVN